MRMKERLYLVEDRSKAVYSDDRRGRHLLCKKGAELDNEVAKKYGLYDGRLSAIMPIDPKAPNPKPKPKSIKDAIKEDEKAKKARLAQEAEFNKDIKKKNNSKRVVIGYGGN